MGKRVYDAGVLVDVEQRRPEQEDRRENDERDQRRSPHRLVAEAVQQEDEDEPAEEDDDHERGQRSECVHVVGSREPRAATQRSAESALLDERGGCAEADEREERERDEVEAGEDRDALHDQGEKRDERNGEGDNDSASVDAERKPARTDVRSRPQRRADRRHQSPHERTWKLHESRAREPGSDAQRERRPEARPVQPQRLGYDLADRARLRRKRRR